MASFVVASHDVRVRGTSSAKQSPGFSLRGVCAVLGGGAFAGVFAFTAFVSLHNMAQASHGIEGFDTRLAARLDHTAHDIVDATERNLHIRKFSRLSSHGHPKMVRLADAHHLDAKAFIERSGALLDAENQSNAQALAALKPSSIVDSALGRTSELAMLETQAKEHPAFEVALAKPQATADDEIDLLPETIPLPSFRPQIARAAEAEPSKSAAQQSPAATTMVAFARPDNPLRETKTNAVPWPDRGNGTAIYDISAGVVHMPGGEKLEAHSGIGKMRDNPDFVHVKMRGATPPSSYKLTMREALFHGVEAIRLTPESGINPHGRNGLLAHTYMLARRGESNGCVVFKDYPKFLAAFKRGEIKRIVVVPKLSGRPAMAAKSGGKTLFGMLAKRDTES